MSIFGVKFIAVKGFIDGATVCLFLALKSAIADNIFWVRYQKMIDVCQYIFSPNWTQKQHQLAAEKDNCLNSLEPNQATVPY